MFAVVQYGGNQYLLHQDKIYNLPDFEYDKKNKKFCFDDILLVSSKKKEYIGTPKVENAQVCGDVIREYLGPKKTSIKFKAKKRYKRVIGSRQKMVEIKINEIKV